MIKNDAGQVAIRRVPPVQKYVKIGKNEYVFVIRADIALAWIEPEDVDKVLALKESCNCPNAAHRIFYSLSDETHTRRWLNNGGR